MHRREQPHPLRFTQRQSSSRMTVTTLTLLLLLAFVFLFVLIVRQPAQGQTYRVIYNFTGGPDGGVPLAGLTVGNAKNFYGTTYSGGFGYGTIFKLTDSSSGWIVTLGTP